MQMWSVQQDKGLLGWEEEVAFPLELHETALAFRDALATIYFLLRFRVQMVEVEETPERLETMQVRISRLRSHLIEELAKTGKTF